MVDHHQIAQELSAESRAILLAVHKSITEHDKHASRREIRTAALLKSYSILDRELDHLIFHQLLRRTAPMESRNLRITPLGRGVIIELLRLQQLSLIA